MSEALGPLSVYGEDGSGAEAVTVPREKRCAVTSAGEQQQSQSQSEALVESAPDAVIVSDAEGRIVLANAEAERLLGYDRTELLGRDVEMLIPDRFRARHVQHRGAYLKDPRTRPMGIGLNLWARRRDGTEVPIDVSLSTIQGEQGPLVTAFVRDITDRRATEAALRESEERFALLVSNVADHAIFMLDPNGNVLTWNSTAERIKGYSSEEILGRHFSVFYPPADVEARKPDSELATASEHGLFRGEGWRIRHDGSRFWADVSITPLWGEGGKLRGFAKVTRDSTERHEAHARLVAINDIARAALESRPGPEVLRLTASYARQLSGASAVWLVTPEPDGQALVAQAADGPGADQLLGVTVRVDSSLAGEAMRTGHPVTVADLSSDGRVETAVKERGFGPAVFVPLAGSGGQLGVLVVARERSAPTFDPAQIALVELFAAQTAVALSYSQARAELERMERVEDRERIARNLHDTVIQRLFATGMVLQATEPLIDQAEARARLQRAVEDLDETIRAIRTTIFELEERRRARPSLRSEILEVVSETTGGLGFDPVVRFAGPIDAIVSREVATQLLPTLREALSNVVRHAHATRLEVLVDASDSIVLRVVDNGRGVDMSSHRTGKGLRNMGERASALGGELELAASPDGGTVLTWRVPSAG